MRRRTPGDNSAQVHHGHGVRGGEGKGGHSQLAGAPVALVTRPAGHGGQPLAEIPDRPVVAMEGQAP